MVILFKQFTHIEYELVAFNAELNNLCGFVSTGNLLDCPIY